MKSPSGNVWDQPKHRKALEGAVRSIARVFEKEKEFDAFMKARDKLVAAMKDGITAEEYVALKRSSDYQALRKAYLDANPTWIEPVSNALLKIYALGVERGRSNKQKKRL